MKLKHNSICFVIPKFVTFSTGGAELQVHLLSQQFLRDGWDVEVICRGIGHEENIAKSRYYDNRIKYSYYKRTSLFSSDFFKVFRLLRKTESKWIYNRTDDAATAAVVAFSKLRGRKSVYALASDDDAKRGKYAAEYKKIEYNNILKRIIRLCDIAILDKMAEWGKKNADIVLCQTETQQLLFEKSFDRKTEVVSNSAELVKSESCEKENIILWVGNFRAVKQPELFIKLAKEFKHRYDWKFVMIGEADNSTLHLIEDIKDQKNFSFKGSLSYDETSNWFKKSRMYVNTSSVEGFPNTFVQAWLNHCHIVSLNANPDHLLDNPTMGKVFNGDFNQMVNYIREFTDNTIYLNGSALMAYKYAVNRFDININTSRIMKIFKLNT